MMKKYRSYLLGHTWYVGLIVLFLTLHLAHTSALAQSQNPGQSKPNFCGSGTSACACTEQLIAANDNEESLPPDADPKKDDGGEYELLPASTVEANGKNAGSIVIVEGWSKTPEEILNEAVSLLNPGQKRMWEHLRTNGSSPPWLPWADLIQFRTSGKLQGPYEYVDVTRSNADSAYIVKYMVLGWGPKNCFFRMGPGAKPEMKLDFCITNTWLNGEPQRQLTYYLDTRDPTLVVAAMDFVVGFAPFLGTADLIFNQDTIQKALNGQLDAAADLSGSIAGDLFCLTKGLKAANLFKSSKIVQGVSVGLGASSVVFTGGYLWGQSDWGGREYGRAAFMGVDVAMMLLDRDTRTFITQFSKREFFKRKKPAAAPLTCNQNCPIPNPAVAKFDAKTHPVTTIRREAMCKTVQRDNFPDKRNPPGIKNGEKLPFSDLKREMSAQEVLEHYPFPAGDIVHMDGREVPISQALKPTKSELVEKGDSKPVNWSKHSYKLELTQPIENILPAKVIEGLKGDVKGAKKNLEPYFHEDPEFIHETNWRINLIIGKNELIALRPEGNRPWSRLSDLEWIRKSDWNALIAKAKQEKIELGATSEAVSERLERGHFPVFPLPGGGS